MKTVKTFRNGQTKLIRMEYGPCTPTLADHVAIIEGMNLPEGWANRVQAHDECEVVIVAEAFWSPEAEAHAEAWVTS